MKIENSIVGLRVAFVLAWASVVSSLHADDWPQWRGPRRDAVSLETHLEHNWGPHGPPLVWHVQGLGQAYASVVVSDGVLVTQGTHGNDLVATALDARTGKRRWSLIIGNTSRMPSSTPNIDGDRVYILDPDGELLALEFATGKTIWQVHLKDDFAGVMMSGRGYGETPLVDGERLICTPGGPDAMMVALNKFTGEIIWKATIPPLGEKGKDSHGFSSAVVTEGAGVRQYVQLVGRGLIGVAADDGRFLWGYNDISSHMINIPTPVVRGDLVFSANGYNAGSALVQIVRDEVSRDVDGKPTFTAKEIYRLGGNEFQNHHGGVMLVGDHIYGGHGSNNGFPTCLELETGKITWKRRGPGVGSAAVIAVDGHLIFRYQDGLIANLEATPEGFQIAGTLQIPGAGGDSWAHPALANGLLYLREKDHLWVYDLRKGSEARIAADADEVPEALRDDVKRLRTLQVAVSVLTIDDSAVRIDTLQKMYRYATDGIDDKTPALVAVLTAQHVSSDGMVDSNMIAALRELSAPLIVSLAGTNITEAGLQQLTAVPNLRGLNLESCPAVTDASLKVVATCRELRTLILLGTAVTGEGLSHLISLPHLAALDLEACEGIADESCSVLAKMPQLKALRLRKTAFESKNVTDVGLAKLAPLKQLEWLDLYANGITDAGLATLEEIPKLRELNISLMGFTDAGLKHIATLAEMQHLELLYSEGFAGPTVTDRGAMHLTGLKKLRSLNLTGANITDATLAELGKLDHLQLLQIVDTETTQPAIAAFQQQHPECTVTHGESAPVVDTGD